MRPPPPPRVPDVSPGELSAYYGRLQAALLDLEHAWEAGGLAPLLEAPETLAVVGRSVLDVYTRLAQRHRPSRHPFRRASIHVVTEGLQDFLREPRRWFEARTVEDSIPEGDTDEPQRRWRLEFEGERGPITLSPRQAIAARFWGIGFEIGDPELEADFVRRLLDFVLDRLASDITGIRRVEGWLRRVPRIEPATRVAPDLAGRKFEHLMLDILNEHRPLARHATLFEDFVEKTDLRVRAPGLVRRRGARVQVTQTVDQRYHEEKVAHILHPDEIVLLSPLTLAQAMGSERAAELLDEEELPALWSVLPPDFTTVRELAHIIKERFLTAIGRPRSDPRGPLALVPSPLRSLIRHFVCAEAHRSTKLLRARQRSEG